MALPSVACALMTALPVLADPLDHALGKALFDRIWTTAPAVTQATDGLGPLFNARSCAACHPKAGRGRFNEDERGRITGTGLVLRLGDATGAGDPVYGTQLQTLAVAGLGIEGSVRRGPDGRLVAVDLMYGAPAKSTRMAGRLAPALHGLGQLERISEHVILAKADPDDANHDGISGRANYADDEHGERVLSRFGWKAGKASVHMQSAAAFHTDIGLSNPAYPLHGGDCTESQTECLAAPHGATPRFENLEIDTRMLNLVTAYVSNLKAPAQPWDGEGTGLFARTGCANCHTPEFALADGTKISPYTDLLLHDMGDGLADGIGDGEATGREWRTAPLWGLGRVTRFLHDGRAANVRQAIALHGGEAQRARDAFFALTPSAQDRLLALLSNL